METKYLSSHIAILMGENFPGETFAIFGKFAKINPKKLSILAIRENMFRANCPLSCPQGVQQFL